MSALARVVHERPPPPPDHDVSTAVTDSTHPILHITTLQEPSQVDEGERTSSETAIFAIYSMYDDDWKDAIPQDSARFTSGNRRYSPSLVNNRPLGDSLSRSTDLSSASDANHFGSVGSGRPMNGSASSLHPSRASDAIYKPRHSQQPLRPNSSASTPSEPHGINKPHRARSRPSSPSRRAYSRDQDDRNQPDRMDSLRPRRIASQPQLIRAPLCSGDEHVDLPPIPIISIPPSSPARRSRALSTSRSHSNLKIATQYTKIDPTSPSLGSSKVSPTPSSLTSLAPSDGEDPDAFHVRNTYAQLEISGVKGDGYQDGVERTRARIGTSLASQRDAQAALADGTEKMGDLSPEELQALSSLDRYGFFDVPSHDRLLLIPNSPLRKSLSRVAVASRATPPSPPNLPSIPPIPAPNRESSRIGKWTRMLVPERRDVGSNIQSWTVRPSKAHKLRERTYKGIPDRWRSAAWEFSISRATQGGHEVAQLEAAYEEELDKPSTYDIQIDLDVPRTISGHVMFRTRYGTGQRSLFHVLHSFSLHCSQCGYVQGMGPIAATLLCYSSPAHVYATLVRLHSNPFYSLHTIFSPGFPGLLEAIYVQERIIQSMMPNVYQSFKTHTISTTSYATKWYITLFANSVPFQCQLRLWDVFLLEGKDLFVITAVAIVWVYREHITSSAANFETMLSLLSSFFIPEDENMLLAWIQRALGNKKLRARMTAWRSDWGDLVARGQTASALL